MANYLSKVIIDGTEALIKDGEARNLISGLSNSVTAELEKIREEARRAAKRGYAEALNSVKVINIPHPPKQDHIDLSYNYSIDVSRTIYALTVVINGELPVGDSTAEGTIMTTFVFPGTQLIEETGMVGKNSLFRLVNHYSSTNDGYVALALQKTAAGKKYWQNMYRLGVYKENTNVTDNSSIYATAYTFQTNHIPYYFYDYLPKRIETLRNLDSSVRGHGDSFVFLTDPHIENNSDYSPALISYILDHTETKTIILGGDYCNGPFSANATYNQIAENVEKYKYLSDTVYCVRGNHDSGQYWNGPQLTPAMLYSILCDHIDGMPITSPLLYHCHDNTDQKIRYFILDSGDKGALDSDQITWLTQKSHELPADWTIVAFVHQGIGDETEGDTKNVYLYTSGTQIVNALAGCSAHVACVVCGHMHIDLNYSVGNYSFIATTCDNPHRIFSKHDRTHGTIKENAFDIFHINTSTKTVSVTRIGGGAGDPTTNPAVNDRVFSYK